MLTYPPSSLRALTESKFKIEPFPKTGDPLIKTPLAISTHLVTYDDVIVLQGGYLSLTIGTSLQAVRSLLIGS